MDKIWLDFFFHLIYRYIRFLVHGFQSQVIWRFTGVKEDLDGIIRQPTSSKDCQLLTILYRKKLAGADMTSANDFVWFHRGFVSARDVLAKDPCWTLYTLDEEYAYFVKMPHEWPFYHAREAPFVLMRQFEVGTQLARMPFKAFCKFSEESLPEPKGPVVYYSNAARSGTTLLTRVMQVSPKRIICLGEPDAFTALTIFQQRGYISEDRAVELLKAIFKYYCKHQNPGQTYLMKVQSNGARIVPFIKRAMPRVKHMFTYRRNTRRVLSSLEKILRGATAGDVQAFFWNYCPWLAGQWINCGFYEWELYRRFHPRDCLDQAIICHVGSWYYYYRCKDIFDIPMIYYEDLMADKEGTLKSVFEVCEIPYEEFIEEALAEFQFDSQGGTAVSQDNMKEVKDTPVDMERIQYINDMCDELHVPRIPV